MAAYVVGDEVQRHLAPVVPAEVVPRDEADGVDHHGFVAALDGRDQDLMADAHELAESRHPRRHTRRGPRARRPGRPGRRVGQSRCGLEVRLRRRARTVVGVGMTLLELRPARHPPAFALLHDVAQGLGARLTGDQAREGHGAEE